MTLDRDWQIRLATMQKVTSFAGRVTCSFKVLNSNAGFEFECDRNTQYLENSSLPFTATQWVLGTQDAPCSTTSWVAGLP